MIYIPVLKGHTEDFNLGFLTAFLFDFHAERTEHNV